MPAAFAAAIPGTESSTTRQVPGSAPRRAAARRNRSGAGLPRATSEALQTAPEEPLEAGGLQREADLPVASGGGDGHGHGPGLQPSQHPLQSGKGPQAAAGGREERLLLLVDQVIPETGGGVQLPEMVEDGAVAAADERLDVGEPRLDAAAPQHRQPGAAAHRLAVDQHSVHVEDDSVQGNS